MKKLNLIFLVLLSLTSAFGQSLPAFAVQPPIFGTAKQINSLSPAGYTIAIIIDNNADGSCKATSGGGSTAVVCWTTGQGFPIVWNVASSTGSSSFPSSTVALLPAASSNLNKVYLVTNAASGTDCTVGNGTTYTICASNGTAWVNATSNTGGGTIAVIAGPTWLTWSLSGTTYTAVTNSQTADTFLAAPCGSGGAPVFRVICATDLPTVPIANGGTGQTTQQTAMDALAGGAVTAGLYQRANGTHVVQSAIQSADIPNNAANTTGNAATATALAATPTQCTGSNFSQGSAANGNANCAIPAGGGAVGVGAFTATTTTLTLGPNTYRNNSVVTNDTTTTTVVAGASSLATGAQIWASFDPVSKNKYLDYTAAGVTIGNLTLTNITAGNSGATTWRPGMTPLFTCTGGSTANQWTTTSTSCFPANGGVAFQSCVGGTNTTAAYDANGACVYSSTGGTSNPTVTKTYVTPSAASCPSTATTLLTYTLPATIAAGDMIDVDWVMARNGTAGTAQYGTLIFASQDLADAGNLGNNLTIYNPGGGFTGQTGNWFRAQIQIVSSTAATARISRSVHGSSYGDIASYFTGLTISGTPSLVFQAYGCSSTDTLQLVTAAITVYKAQP